MKLAGLALMIGLSAAAASCTGQGSAPEQNEQAIEKTVTPDTDLTKLRSITPIAGQPQRVWWSSSPMGKHTPGSVPGPTDTRLEVLLDYGTAEAVTALIADKQSNRSVELVPAVWFPAALKESLNSDGTVSASQYKKVINFDPDARISVPSDMPSYVLVHLISD